MSQLPSPLNIMQVLPALHSGGVERGTVDIAKALVASGMGAWVVSSGGPMVAELEACGAQHITLPVQSKNPLQWRHNAANLVKLVKKHNIHLLHVRSRAPAAAAGWAAQRASIPWVTTFHGTYSLGPWGLKKIYNSMMLEGNKVIAGSQFIADHLQQHYHTAQEHICLIPRGVDMDYFDPTTVKAQRKKALHSAWQLQSNTPLILLPGRITHWKGQKVLLQALASLPASLQWQCILLGSSKGREGYAAEVNQLITALKLTDRVSLQPPCSDMPAAYALADAVVSASTDPEAFGRVSAEASAMQRPVIASAHGGSLETVLDGQSGWLTAPSDTAALAHALKQALSQTPKEKQAMGECGRKHIQTHFNLQHMQAQTLALYQHICTEA